MREKNYKMFSALHGSTDLFLSTLYYSQRIYPGVSEPPETYNNDYHIVIIKNYECLFCKTILNALNVH